MMWQPISTRQDQAQSGGPLKESRDQIKPNECFTAAQQSA